MVDGFAAQPGTGMPLSRAPMSAPVRAITASSWNHSVGPTIVHSRPAADSTLPTSRLARRKASVSIGPDGGTPTCQKPTRPG